MSAFNSVCFPKTGDNITVLEMYTVSFPVSVMPIGFTDSIKLKLKYTVQTKLLYYSIISYILLISIRKNISPCTTISGRSNIVWLKLVSSKSFCIALLPFVRTGRPDRSIRKYYSIICRNRSARLVNSEIACTLMMDL